MRWPLTNQILLPMVGVMLAALTGVSILNAYLSARRTRVRIEQELIQVTDTLADSTFPLTDRVMRQMRGLSGAEFVLTDSQGDPVASSLRQPTFVALPRRVRTSHDATPALTGPVEMGGRRFFHTAIALRRPGSESRPGTLHVFYPEASYLQAWRDVVYSPLLVGGVAIILVVGLSVGIASRVTEPLRRLQSQVNQIAHGKFRSLPVPRRDDEVADLSRSINQMAETLAQYEIEVRRNERLRTLGQLGGGIAHQMRNSVTGCRIAVELHARQCRRDDGNLEVVMRQLELTEKYLRRFLSLGRANSQPHTRVDLQSVVESVVSLVAPTAKHVGVEIEWNLPDEPIAIRGDADALEQLTINLILNGIEAASLRPQRVPGSCSSKAQRAAYGAPQHETEPVRSASRVAVSLRSVADRAELAFTDSGCGPSAEVEARVFEPFVTEKADGTGLGLPVAREIAVAHGGEIRWHRRETTTCFVVDFPLLAGDDNIS